jgi:amino acid adenylation domain-containing protein
VHASCRPQDVFVRFAIQACARPAAPALMWKGSMLTYGELLERCERLSARLRRLGVGPETIVALRMERSDDLVAAILAVLHAGAAYLPLDLSIPLERAGYMLESSHASVLLTDAGRADELKGDCATVEVTVEVSGDAPSAPNAASADPGQLAYVLYTSGSSGKPKGVQISRGAFNNVIASFEGILGAGPDDVFLSVTGISFDIFELEVMLPLATGGLLILAERERVLEHGYLAGLVTRHRATLFQTTPTLARNLLDGGWQPDPGLRILIGGEALTVELAHRLQRAEAVFNVYGPTEATIWVSSNRVDSARPPVIGTALDHTSLHVLDAQLDEVAASGTGELFIAGAQLARGYAGRPDLTAERFIPSPFVAGERLYRTGDLVRRNEDGTFEFLGRADQQVKLRGHRIELGEIDAVLAAHPGVASAVTIVREDSPGNAMLVAYYTADADWLDQPPDAQLTDARITAWEDIYDGRYAEEDDAAGNGDHSVWIDSRSGEPYTPAKMQEWIDTTVARIAEMGARRLLEIGCGSGQLLLRLADRVDCYIGSDVSAQALHALHRKTAHLRHVELRHLPADRTDELRPERFDLVVINSVAQYFPSAAYLVDVLRQAQALLAAHGSIFVGDVRHRGLLEAFYAAVEMGRSHDALSAAQLSERVARRAKLETELCLDPGFFVGMKERLGFGSVQLLSRRGEADTEMNAFRFDAVLRGAADDAAPPEAPVRVQWRADVWNAAHFEALLARCEGAALRIDGLPDARSRAALEALRHGSRAARASGFHPEALIRIANRFGRRTLAGAPDARGTFDMLMVSCDAPPVIDMVPEGSTAHGACATRPLEGELLRRLEEQLRVDAARRLPDYMVPSVLVQVDRFPLDPSGKLDRHALPRPRIEAGGAAEMRDEAQATIASAMAEVLGLPERPGPQGDFFKLGGHSLAAVRFAARLRERFGAIFDLHAVFDLRTVEALAARLRAGGEQCDLVASLPLGDYAAGTRVPLSRAQSSLWFLDRLDGASAIYNMPLAVRVEGVLDVDALRHAIAKVVDRHHALRTTYVEIEGAPVGILNEPGLAELEVEAVGDGVEVVLVEAARVPFDLGRDPMLRARMFRLDARTHVLLLIVHHIAADGLSMVVLAREIAAFYAAAAGGADHAPPQVAQYADFARWQRETIHESTQETQLAWWRWHLQDVPEVLELPTDRPRPSVAAHKGCCVPIDIPAPLREDVEALARTHEVSAYAVLLSAFGILLGRLSNQREVIVGVPAGGRQSRQLEHVVGLFANVLPLRINASAGASVADAVRATSATLREALARQYVAFDQIVEHLCVARSLDRMPLVQAVFTYLDAQEDLALPDLRTQVLPIHLGTARFDLTLQLGPSDSGGWRGMMEFDADLFDASTIERWAGHFEHLLREMARDRAKDIAELPLAAGASRECHVSGGRVPIEDLVTVFERRCDEAPDALALVCREERFTFSQLAARVDRIADALDRAGVTAGHVVGLHLERNADLVAAIWGVLKVGAAFLPLDTAVPVDRLQYMLSQSHAGWVISESITDVAFGDHVRLRPRDLLAASRVRTVRARCVPPQALAYVIFTSGSTGQPKGVEVPRSAVSTFVESHVQLTQVRSDDVAVSIASIAFDMFVIELLPPHCAGAAVVMADRQQVLDLPYVESLMAKERVSVLIATPSLLSAWSTAGWVPRPGMRVITGGEAIAPELAERLSAQCELWAAYGPTEATCAQTMGRVRAPIGIRSSIGSAFGRNEVFVLDERLNPVPIGVTGELYIAGEQLAQGYAGRADLTAERFMPSPFHVGARLYRTGDLVRWRPDGELQYCGRGDDQVKIRGYRIELGEIEGRLLACAHVASGAIVAREDTAGNKRLVAYVVPEPGKEVDVRSLEAQLAAHLPAYMLPSHFVPLARLPMTRNGKLDKKALPAPDWVATAVHSEMATSVSSLEGKLAGLMAQVLGTDRAIAVNTHFFAAGGHSLAAVRLLARARREFGVEVSLQCFFDDPTPVGLARHVRAAGQEQRERSPFVSFGNGSSGSAVFLVHGADGYAINFRHLGAELSPHVHLYGVDCAHSWLPDGTAETVEVHELAQLYAQRLVRDFPHLAEFHIGGWSFGGLVALEMARHLRQLGVRIASAFAIDSAIKGGAEEVARAIGTSVGIQDLARRDPDAVGDLYAAFQSHVAAASRYEPAAYEGDFTLIMASEGLAVDEHSHARWREIVRGELSMREIEGGHFSILREPAVAALAREIVDCVVAPEALEQ